MAILQAPLSLEAVHLLRGVIDVYMWKGLIVARAWPRAPRQPNTPPQIATRTSFTQAEAWLNSLPTSWRSEMATFPSRTGTTSRNYQRRLGLWITYDKTTYYPTPILSASALYQPLSGTVDLTVTYDPYPQLTDPGVDLYAQPYTDAPPTITWCPLGSAVQRQAWCQHTYAPKNPAQTQLFTGRSVNPITHTVTLTGLQYAQGYGVTTAYDSPTKGLRPTSTVHAVQTTGAP